MAGWRPGTASAPKATPYQPLEPRQGACDGLHPLDDLRGDGPFPLLEGRLQERVPVGEMPVETAAGNAEAAGEYVDTNRGHATVGECAERRVRPVLCGELSS